jgi:hypothetical protein
MLWIGDDQAASFSWVFLTLDQDAVLECYACTNERQESGPVQLPPTLTRHVQQLVGEDEPPRSRPRAVRDLVRCGGSSTAR